MRVFTIENETNNITVHASVQEASTVVNARRFRNEAALARLAADWPTSRLIDIWNGIRGVKQVTRFKDRPTAVSRIWKAIQSLGDSAPSATIHGPRKVAGTRESSVNLETRVGPDATRRTEIASEAQTALPDPGPETSASTLFTEVAPQMPDVATVNASARETAKKTPGTTGAPRQGSKASQVIAMLKREGGTTLEEIMSAMGWQKHTTRAMLSAGGSLTKKHGLVITSQRVGDQRKYSIEP